jgi:hypothetical protein
LSFHNLKLIKRWIKLRNRPQLSKRLQVKVVLLKVQELLHKVVVREASLLKLEDLVMLQMSLD